VLQTVKIGNYYVKAKYWAFLFAANMLFFIR